MLRAIVNTVWKVSSLAAILCITSSKDLAFGYELARLLEDGVIRSIQYRCCISGREDYRLEGDGFVFHTERWRYTEKSLPNPELDRVLAGRDHAGVRRALDGLRALGVLEFTGTFEVGDYRLKTA